MESNNRFSYQIERPAAPAAKKRGLAPMVIALMLAFSLLAGGVGGVVGYNLGAGGEPASQQTIGAPVSPAETPRDTVVPVAATPQSSPGGTASAQTGALSIQDIFTQGDKSTVAISTTSNSVNVFGQQVPQASAGSGFVLTADGYILTNHHVIEDATGVTVLMSDGSEYPAEIVGSDAKTDLAVLKVKASGLNPVKIGDSDSMAVGDLVVAIGNPLGELANSLTVGYLSAKKRIIFIDDTPRQMLQTDASVSPGNSGGPLFNSKGEVVGVVSAKTVAEGVEGIGFAIPVNLAVGIANDLIRDGAILGRPLLGISFSEISALQNAEDYPKGVYVALVNEGTAAETAGLKEGDVITAMNGERITSGSELQLMKDLYRVGDTVTLTVWRNGTESDLSVTFTQEMTETPVEEEPVEEWPYGSFFPWGGR